MEARSTVIKATVTICVFICLCIIIYLENMKMFYLPTSNNTLEPQPQWSQYSYSGFVNRVTALRHPSLRSRCSCVTFGYRMRGGIGNHLFYYSATVYVAWLTGRHICLLTSSRKLILNELFDIHIPQVNIKKYRCPSYKFKQRGVGLYDARVESLINISPNKYLLLDGYFQSWMYAHTIAAQLRQDLCFKKELKEFVADFLSRTVPLGWSKLKFVRVGVHVRRGNFLTKSGLVFGYTSAGERYLQKAMTYFVKQFPRVQFIVSSNDIKWCQKHMTLHNFNKTNVNIVFSVKHSAGQDLALLASCNHTVMSTGTYSWWAAWLANGTTIYYANYPNNGSLLSRSFRNKEYYYPHWIGMTT